MTKPKVSDGRTRRLEPGELDQLLEACRRSRNPHVLAMVEFAIETAMRRGEVLRLRWQDIDWTKRTLHIPIAKNGHARTIPLTGRALIILRARPTGDAPPDTLVFLTTEDAVKMAWRRIMRRCRLRDFRYHDLRHEAVSRFRSTRTAIPSRTAPRFSDEIVSR